MEWECLDDANADSGENDEEPVEGFLLVRIKNDCRTRTLRQSTLPEFHEMKDKRSGAGCLGVFSIH